jgi:predicted dehydrogenase
MNEPLRHVIIGVGAGIFDSHRVALQASSSKVVAVSDVNPATGQRHADELQCPYYQDHKAMLTNTQADVAVILTPHPFHAAIAIDCLRAGCHVLVEKPMAIQVAEADAMIDVATQQGKLLAVSYQQRYAGTSQTIHTMLQQGQIGKILHVNLTAVWPRTAAYYKLAAWRATWRGEGGGVLMNQAPHQLDLLCFLFGLPSKVVAWTRTILHNIETEDTLQAMVEWENGTLGSVHISTAEVHKEDRLEIIGTAGILKLSNNHLEYTHFKEDWKEFLNVHPNGFASPEMETIHPIIAAGNGDHQAVYQNLHDAILKGTPLLSDGQQGRMSLELANAMILSSYDKREVSLPLDRNSYAALLTQLQAKNLGG